MFSVVLPNEMKTSSTEGIALTVDAIRNTSDDKLAGVLRLLLAMVFLMTGVMKLVVPVLAEAWSGQLLAANLPFYTLTRWSGCRS